MNGPQLTATIYTDRIGPDYFHAYSARGYLHGGRGWAKVQVGGLDLVAVDDEGMAGMQRLVDALQSAMAQAKQARQDADFELVSA